MAATASDATLVRGVLDGDRAAFAQLYDLRARLVRAVCYDATGDLQTAAELTQEVFLRAYDRLGALREKEKFAAWVCGIARQVCREWRRGRARERDGLGRFSRWTEDSGSAAVPQLLEVRIRELRDAIATLPEKERLALHAFYLQEQDVEQARAVLGLSRSGFYHVLSCARRRLRRKLDREEVA